MFPGLLLISMICSESLYNIPQSSLVAGGVSPVAAGQGEERGGCGNTGGIEGGRLWLCRGDTGAGDSCQHRECFVFWSFKIWVPAPHHHLLPNTLPDLQRVRHGVHLLTHHLLRLPDQQACFLPHVPGIVKIIFNLAITHLIWGRNNKRIVKVWIHIIKL